MNAESGSATRAEVIDEISKWTIGPGIVLVALAPLALPILALTAVAIIPLLVPLLAVGLLVGGVALVTVLIRSMGRLARRVLSPNGHRRPTSA
jgi:hypothetical protein